MIGFCIDSNYELMPPWLPEIAPPFGRKCAGKLSNTHLFDLIHKCMFFLGCNFPQNFQKNQQIMTII